VGATNLWDLVFKVRSSSMYIYGIAYRSIMHMEKLSLYKRNQKIIIEDKSIEKYAFFKITIF
jgi:hypothetical protein